MRPTGGFGGSVGCLWLLGSFCWKPLVGEEILAISVPTLIPIVFLLSLPFPCLFNDDIKYEHAHNSHTGGGERSCKVTK